ncbi:hypothetical protein SELMODRAFT_414523 [Selaginella moellendorffii]|uniref:Uncharacterized protein n=1 Tax=Selaginella moellendorffii TaxID=88036 RepID=D8RT14_SELML|nr:hypothetical protein SELMODRAFT_414523 [Selaginella moellendorffii]
MAIRQDTIVAIGRCQDTDGSPASISGTKVFSHLKPDWGLNILIVPMGYHNIFNVLKIGDQNIEDASLGLLFGIGVVPQKKIVFNDTINIRYGRLSATEEEARDERDLE